MTLVVFMRGVNVGGHKTFQPSVLAKQLAHCRMTNVGAAGTFVIRGSLSQLALRMELARALPFEAELMICPARDVIEVVETDPFPDGPATKDLRRYVSILARRPAKLPRLPVVRPEGDRWQVKVIGVFRRFGLSLWRRTGERYVDPNGVVEKMFGVSATTRNWTTLSKIAEILTATRSV